MLERCEITLLLLAEENDQTDYMQQVHAQGIVYRSTDEPALVDAVRRVARGELSVQERSSDIWEGEAATIQR